MYRNNLHQKTITATQNKLLISVSGIKKRGKPRGRIFKSRTTQTNITIDEDEQKKQRLMSSSASKLKMTN